MALESGDSDSARVTAVMRSLDQVNLPTSMVESVSIEGEEARVALRGANGFRATVRLFKSGPHRQIMDVGAA